MRSRLSLWRGLHLGRKTDVADKAAALPGQPARLDDRSLAPDSATRRLAEKIGYLRQIDIFADLTAEDIGWIQRITAMYTCGKGQIMYAPGETGEVLFLLKKGRVQIYRLSSEGKKLVIATLEAGTFFGEMALVGQGMHDSFAEAIEPSLVCALSRADLHRILAAKPAVALRLLDVIGQRLLAAHVALEDLAFKLVPERLAALLLRLRQLHGDTIEGISHQDLADMAGTLRETTTQVLDQFKAAGWIETGRRRIVIRDAAALQAVSEGLRRLAPVPR